MLVSDLQDELALHVHDPNYGEISAAQWLMFINSAARDLRDSGWLVRQTDDTSIVTASNDFDYDVPAGFAYVSDMFIEETINGVSVYVRRIPRHHWTIRENPTSGNPEFYFSTISELVSGKHLRIIGQKRPTIYTSPTETLNPGMEAFLRERALCYGARFLGAGSSELARWRQTIAGQALASSEQFLRRQPQEMRELPDSIEVPGRG